MMVDAVIDALQSNEKYAKAIVQLAGIHTATVDGLALDVAEYWDGHDFMPPVFLSVVANPGRISWAHESFSPRIHYLTFDKVIETFTELAIPSNFVIMSVVISNLNKKPYFKKFTFRSESFPWKPYDEIWLRHRSWNVDELEQAVKQLRKLKRSLKGKGY